MVDLATKIGDYLKDKAIDESTGLVEFMRVFCLKIAYGFYRTAENIERIKEYQQVWEFINMKDKEKNAVVAFATRILNDTRILYRRKLERLNPEDVSCIRSPGNLFAYYHKFFDTFRGD